MIISKNNKGEVIGYTETYIGPQENVTVSVNGNTTSISSFNRTTGKSDVKTFFGKPILPTDPASKK